VDKRLADVLHRIAALEARLDTGQRDARLDDPLSRVLHRIAALEARLARREGAYGSAPRLATAPAWGVAPPAELEDLQASPPVPRAAGSDPPRDELLAQGLLGLAEWVAEIEQRLRALELDGAATPYRSPEGVGPASDALASLAHALALRSGSHQRDAASPGATQASEQVEGVSVLSATLTSLSEELRTLGARLDGLEQGTSQLAEATRAVIDLVRSSDVFSTPRGLPDAALSRLVDEVRALGLRLQTLEGVARQPAPSLDAFGRLAEELGSVRMQLEHLEEGTDQIAQATAAVRETLLRLEQRPDPPAPCLDALGRLVDEVRSIAVGLSELEEARDAAGADSVPGPPAHAETATDEDRADLPALASEPLARVFDGLPFDSSSERDTSGSTHAARRGLFRRDNGAA